MNQMYVGEEQLALAIEAPFSTAMPVFAFPKKIAAIVLPTIYLALRFTILLLVAGCVLIYGNQYRTSYTIDVDRVGKHYVYQHEDARTTNIINYLTGRGRLPERERLPLYRQYVRNVLEQAKMKVPENISSLDRVALDALAIEWYLKQYPKQPRDAKVLQLLIDRLFEQAVKPPLEGFGPEVDDKIWHMMIAVGSPKIRWTEEQDAYASRLVAYSAGDRQSFYDPVDNTIYITYMNSVNTLLTEVGHPKQFRDEPVRSYARLASSLLHSLVAARFDTAKAQELYGKNYQYPETFEGEAHGPINEVLLRESGLNSIDANVPVKN